VKLIDRYSVILFVAVGLGVSACSDDDGGGMSLGDFELALPQDVADMNIPDFFDDDAAEFYPVIEVGTSVGSMFLLAPEDSIFPPTQGVMPASSAIVRANQLFEEMPGSAVSLRVSWYDSEQTAQSVGITGPQPSIALTEEEVGAFKMVEAVYMYPGPPMDTGEPERLEAVDSRFPNNDGDALSNYTEFVLGTEWREDGDGEEDPFVSPNVDATTIQGSSISAVAELVPAVSPPDGESLCNVFEDPDFVATVEPLVIEINVAAEEVNREVSISAIHDGEFVCIKTNLGQLEVNEFLHLEFGDLVQLFTSSSPPKDFSVGVEQFAIITVDEEPVLLAFAAIDDVAVTPPSLINLGITINESSSVVSPMPQTLVLQRFDPEANEGGITTPQFTVNFQGTNPTSIIEGEIMMLNENSPEQPANECLILIFDLFQGSSPIDNSTVVWTITREDNNPPLDALDASNEFQLPPLNVGEGAVNRLSVVAQVTGSETPVGPFFITVTDDVDIESGVETCPAP